MLTACCFKSHFAIVLQEDVAEFPQLFGAIADAYFDDKMYAEALEVYQDMAENEEVRFSVPLARRNNSTELTFLLSCFLRPMGLLFGSRWRSATNPWVT